jgi:hypothetical protein
MSTDQHRIVINKVYAEYACRDSGITRDQVKGIVNFYLEKAFEQLAEDEVFHMQGYLSLKKSMSKFKPRRLGRHPSDGSPVIFKEKPSVLQLKCQIKKKGLGIARQRYASLVRRFQQLQQQPQEEPPPLPPPPPQPAVLVGSDAEDSDSSLLSPSD